MKRTIFLLYGTVCYLLFFVTFCYAIGFTGGLIVPKSLDYGSAELLYGPAWFAGVSAILINVLLLGIFGLQHSIMARREFKVVWMKIVPEPIERSTFVLATCICLNLMFWQWRLMPEIVWQIGNPAAIWMLKGLFFLGFGIVFYATVLIDHFDLFGLRQVWGYFKNQKNTSSAFVTPSMYNITRHPLYLGFMIAFWATPVMTQSHLLFAAVTTIYMLVAIQLEERDLTHIFGDTYREYKKRVPMILPFPKGSK